MCDIIIILLLIVHFYSPLTSPVDGGPLPSTLIAYTFTVIAVVGGQNEDVKMSNVWLHFKNSSQSDAGMLNEPQMVPKIESE